MSQHNSESMASRILIIDDDQDFRWAMKNVIVNAGYDVFEAEDGQQGLKILKNESPHLILIDFRMPGEDGLQITKKIRAKLPQIPVVMITAFADVKSAVSAMKIGVYDYVAKPIDNNDLLYTIKRALEHYNLKDEVIRLKHELAGRHSIFESMGKSEAIQKLFGLIKKVAPTEFTVLIQGESGTGKELVAHAIHDLSRVKNGPFVPVDCGAIPETLIESELFGYKKGAFTGADTDKQGQFALADGGTLFLDEIGNLSYAAQQKLLRAMQERCIQRLGASKSQKVKVRVIAATNDSLENKIKAETFRKDLFFRLNEFTVTIPPLRNRYEDIPYLAKRFMDEAQTDLQKVCRGFTKQVLTALTQYSWAGNVRELRNVIRQAVLLCDANCLIESHQLTINSSVNHNESSSTFSADKPEPSDRSLPEIVKDNTKQLETVLIQDALKRANGNKSLASRTLGIDYKTLLRKIKTYQL